MAQTLKRNPYELSGSTTNYSKYYTQLGFTGIKHIQNLFEVDQMSFKNAKNVYIDEDQTLVSRLPLINEPLPTGYVVDGIQTKPASILKENHLLVDKISTNKITIFVTQHKTTLAYDIIAMNETSKELQFGPDLVNKYHICPVEKYIIVFNDKDAIVLNSEKFKEGWKLLRDLAEIPTTKRIIGQDVFTQDGNQFTNSYREEYVWSNDIISLLPNGNAEVVINQSPNKLVWLLENANINTEFRLLRPINLKLTSPDLISVATNINTNVTVLCIARNDHVMMSFDNGLSFDRILYPANGGFKNIASVSKDGLNFFFVASDGVYRYDIGNKAWTVIELIAESDGVKETLLGEGYNNVCCFNNAEVFSFPLWREDNGQAVCDLYCKGPNLKTSNYSVNALGYVRIINRNNPLTQANQTRKDLAPFSVYVKVSNSITDVVMWTQANDASSSITCILGNNDADCIYKTLDIPNKYGAIYDFDRLEHRPGIDYNFNGVKLEGIVSVGNTWEVVIGNVGQEYQQPISGDAYEWVDIVDFKYPQDLKIPVNDKGAPIDLSNGYISNMTTYSIDGSAELPGMLNGEAWPNTQARTATINDNQYYYIKIGNTLYTNKMIADSVVNIVYTYKSILPYTEVPNTSYVNNELYLSFDNTLKITANHRDGTDLIFNLPKINNQAFTSAITGIKNISTTEVAIFLIDQIYIVMQVADENFGYRYDYYNTRLSSGMRLGDSVINTNDGTYTLYPTAQGLAIMNYQPDVATTDQIVEYVTKNITDIWTKFYNTGKINIVQVKDYVYLTNGTKEYLMLDLRTMSWWQFEVPINIKKLVSNQSSLEVISNALYIFKRDYIKYKDFNTNYINWYIESQPLHFNLPNYYKNIKQLVFQFEESTNVQQTINAQMKLYRKTISYKAPETIAFNVDGYRTFVKRFNYWKVNEIQWALGVDLDTSIPARLKLNCISIKYEQGEEVRA